MIAELQAERDRLDQAIVALERLIRKGQPRRGRPPAWLKHAEQDVDGEEAHESATAQPRQRGAFAGQN